MEIRLELATEPAIKGTIMAVSCVSIAYVATHTETPYGFASALLIGVIRVIISTYKTRTASGHKCPTTYSPGYLGNQCTNKSRWLSGNSPPTSWPFPGRGVTARVTWAYFKIPPSMQHATVQRSDVSQISVPYEYVLWATATVAEWLDQRFKYLKSGVGALRNATTRVGASRRSR